MKAMNGADSALAETMAWLRKHNGVKSASISKNRRGIHVALDDGQNVTVSLEDPYSPPKGKR
jgi:hypothetical protein